MSCEAVIYPSLFGVVIDPGLTPIESCITIRSGGDLHSWVNCEAGGGEFTILYLYMSCEAVVYTSLFGVVIDPGRTPIESSDTLRSGGGVTFMCELRDGGEIYYIVFVYELRGGDLY